MAPFAALLLAALPVAVPLPAPDTVSAARPRHRLSLTVELGGTFTGPSSGLAEQLRDTGFDDTSPGGCLFIFCGGPHAHPTEENPGVAAALTARYAVTPSLAVGLGTATASLGGATGYRGTPESFGDYVFSDWESRVLWGGVFWRPLPSIRLGGGPGWYRLKDMESAPNSVGRVGLVLEAGTELPANRLLFLSLTIRGHLVPTTDVPYHDVVLRPSWSYLTISAGLGFHLF